MRAQTSTVTGEGNALRKGDRVIVRNRTLSGEEIIEGKATVVAVYPQQSRCKVRFDGDPIDETYLRFIEPADKIES